MRGGLVSYRYAHLGYGPLDRDRIGFDKQVTVQSGERGIKSCRFLRIPGQGRGAHVVHGPRGDVGGDRYVAAGAGEDQFTRRGVIAAVDVEGIAGAVADACDPVDLAGRLLDAYDIGDRCQPHRRLRQQVARRATGHIVENLRDRHRLGDRLVVQWSWPRSRR